MREKEFENKVKAFLKDEGCWHLKTWSNGTQREGVPDILICCNGYFVGCEVKGEGGTPSELQLWNVRKINESNGFAMVLYPSAFERFKSFIWGLQEDTFRRFEDVIWR